MTARANPRRVAFDVLREVTGNDAYANLALAKRLVTADLDRRDAGFVTELVSGTCRLMGTYDLIIAAASGRKLGSLQPAVVDLLRLGCHQLLGMGMAPHAAVGATVELARATVGQRVTGLVNAVLRKISKQDLDGWTAQLAAKKDRIGALAITHHHPRWIVDAYAQLLPTDELSDALAANNVAPEPTLVVRPGLAERFELLPVGAKPTPYSPFGATGVVPADVPAVQERRAGVQDEGSQLVALALTRAEAPDGPWLDLCSGPGGKAALLAGLAKKAGTWLLASEAQEHRARLVAQALSAYPNGTAPVVVADGTAPAWQLGSFSRVIADVPCSGLGALRRRPESRWRRSPADVAQLGAVQRDLLRTALDSAKPGGVVAYVTCSPHRDETVAVVDEVLAERPQVARLHAADYLPEVPDCALGDDVQLWPHRHGTDAMYLALLRVPEEPEVA
ncbi:RsmB/NOP family class I SAM-dependent RNA methyltransferase [Tessaracoccus caeni]|uniref:RsmB/NOP family class I SAM-dependent RNA methyltransferase n=1 Tax=Tessaracoccus caeni TaxID=3031239 RepID=UPI0023DC0182|nr:transcription antitermination factor NusB [Tessaracoccus caeni]MDF1489967.1 transcription antitermination factor NusB [Tessaracoccus caeni]